MRNVYILTALWTLDTYIPRFGTNATYALGDLTVTERYQLLARVVEQAWVYLAKHLIEGVDRVMEENAVWLFLFVAPEYYFSRSGNAHAISETEKRNLVGRLATLSGQYTNLILVPGSIAWKKPTVRPDLEMLKKDARTGLRTGSAKSKSRLEKFDEQVKTSVRNELALIESVIDREIEEVLADPWMKLSEKKRVSSREFRYEKREALAKKALDRLKTEQLQMTTNTNTAPEKCFLARNTAYAFYGGREVARYHKRSNYYEVRVDESDGGYVMFEPGGGPDGSGDLFEIDGVKFGIEICFDHSLGFLSGFSTKKPHVQIVMSAAVKLVEKHVFVPPDCFIVHASSEATDTLAYCNTRSKVEKLGMLDDPAERGTLRYAVLPFQIEQPRLLTLEDFIENK